ncbi:MAG TPA: hypothetical protein VJK71_03845 [Gemmatimonadales bacterium]|nr:hypothetical protein [Gemmatimonadales bacterium]
MTPVAFLALLVVQPALPGGLKGQVRSASLEVRGAVAYLIPERSDSFPAAPDTAGIDQREISFVPRVLVVSPGTTVLFRNSDPILHNVFSPSGAGAGFNLGTYPSPSARAHRFAIPGAYVILCHVHPEMVAFVVVVPTPYRAIADAEGFFAISTVPPGQYRLHVWRRGAAPLEQEVHIIPGRMLELTLELVPARRRRE